MTSVSRNTSSAPRILSWPVKSVKKAPRTSKVPAAAAYGRNLDLEMKTSEQFILNVRFKRQNQARETSERERPFRVYEKESGFRPGSRRNLALSIRD